MAVKDRSEVRPGTVLVAEISGQPRRATTHGDNSGKLWFTVEGIDGDFGSLSAAHDAVYDGPKGRISGWRAWTVEAVGDGVYEQAEVRPSEAAKLDTPRKPRARRERTYNPLRKTASGRWFCDGCMHPFEHEGTDAPTTCGHCGAVAADLVAALGSFDRSDELVAVVDDE